MITNLCHSIYQSINDGKRVLSGINKELEHHVFGSDQERFYFGWQWLPEYQKYWIFFKEVIERPSLGDGESLFAASLSEKSCEVRDRLMGMLLDKDTQYALRELQRMSDYRHYREYEIYKQPLNKEPIALSKYGTGSGGQLETPAYIIRELNTRVLANRKVCNQEKIKDLWASHRKIIRQQGMLDFMENIA